MAAIKLSVQSTNPFNRIFLIILLTVLSAYAQLNGQAGVVGYSTKVFADGPNKIKVKEPPVDRTGFVQKHVAFVIPENWKVIHPDSGYYSFTGGRNMVSLTSDRKDQVWIWKDQVNIGYYIDEKTIVDMLSGFAPINEQIKTIKIKGDGQDVTLYIWRAYHIHDGRKEAFTVYTAYKPAPIFDPSIGYAWLFGRSAGTAHEDLTEAEILEMSAYLQTYLKYYEDSKKKNKAKVFKIYEEPGEETLVQADEMDESPVTSEIPEALIQELDWDFQGSPEWIRPAERRKENTVSWQAPSPFRGRYNLNDAIGISSSHLLYLYSRGLEMYELESGKLLWYHQEGYENCRFASGSKDRLIIHQSLQDTIRILSLETGTGRLLWSTSVPGEVPQDWLPDGGTGMLIAVQQQEKESHLIALELSTGQKKWEKTIGHSAGLRNPPLPELWGGLLLTYCDGVEAFSIEKGTGIWSIDDIKLEDQCPFPQMIGDTLMIIDKGNNLNWLDIKTGDLIQQAKLEKTGEYTNMFPTGKRLYVRGKQEVTRGKEVYFLDVYGQKDGELLWSFQDSIPTLSNVIEDENLVFVSTWQGPVALNISNGESKYRTIVSDVGRTYPAKLKIYGDTLVHIGELSIAGVRKSTGEILYRIGFDPFSQVMNLDAIDPQCDELLGYLKFYGKVGLEGTSVSASDPSYLFNLSRSSQESASKLLSSSSYNYGRYLSTGNSDYYYKSQMEYNSAMIDKSFSKAFANAGMLLNVVPKLSSDVAKMTKPERDRYIGLLNMRRRLMDMYQTQEKGDYAYRRMLKRDKRGSNYCFNIVHLPTGKLLYQDENSRYFPDLILDPERNLFYYHELRAVPELETMGTRAPEARLPHGFFLIAKPLKD